MSSSLDLSRWGFVEVTSTDEGNRRVDLMPHSSEDLAPMVAALDAWLLSIGRTRSPVFRADSNPWIIMHRFPIRIPKDD